MFMVEESVTLIIKVYSTLLSIHCMTYKKEVTLMKVAVVSPNPNVYVFELHKDCVRLYLPEIGL